MTTTSLPEAPVLSPIELTARWSDLLPTWRGCSRRTLWLAWMNEDGVMQPMLVPVEDLPVDPDPGLSRALLGLHDAVVEDIAVGRLHLAMALLRSGGPTVNAADAAWAEELRTGLGERLDGSWSLHLAAAGRVTPMVDPPPWAWR